MVDANVKSGSGFAKRVLINIFWGQVGQIAQVGLGFLFSILVVRGLGPALYGVYGLIFSIIGVASLLTSLGSVEIFSRYLPIISKEGGIEKVAYLVRHIFGNRLLATLGIVAVMLVGRDYFSSLFNQPILSSDIWLILILLFSQVLIELFVGLYTALLQTKSLVSARVITQIVNLLACLWLFGVLGPSIEATVIGTLAGSFIGICMYVIGMREYWKPITLIKIDVRPIYSFGLVAWLTNLVTFGLANQSDVLLLGLLLRDSTQVGYYNAALMPLAKLSTLILSGWLPLTLPTLSEKHNIHSDTTMEQTFQAYLKFMIIMTVPSFLFLAFNGHMIVNTLYSDTFLPSVLIFQVYAGFSLFFYLLGPGLATNTLYIVGKQKYVLVLRVIGGCLNILLDVLLIPQLGALGAVIGTALSGSITSFIEIVLVYRYTSFHYPFTFAIKTILASITAMLIVSLIFTVNNLALLCGAFILFIGMFLLILFVLKPLTNTDEVILHQIYVRIRGHNRIKDLTH